MDQVPVSPAPNLPSEPPTNSRTTFLTFFGIVALLAIGFGGVLLGKYLYAPKTSPAAPGVTPTPRGDAQIATLIPDVTANWTTYSITPDPSLGYASYVIKLPASWKQIEHSSNFQDTETFQDDLTNSTYKLIIHQEKNYNNQTGKPYATLREATGLSYDVTTLVVDKQQAVRVLPRAGSESDFKLIFFSRDNKLIFSIELDTPRDGSKITEGEVLFNQILSTFKFLDASFPATIVPTTTTQTDGADLKGIQYSLPKGWEAKLDEKSLFISPINGGGFLSIRVYNDQENTGRREYYCQVSKVCMEGTTYFTDMSIGNISGYVANALDNSGGGPEYFGAKGNKFYIISSYGPPSPNEFEKNYRNVLNSLRF